MTTPAHETTTAGRPTGGGRHCGGAGRCVPAASGGVSVATGTAVVALFLVVSNEGEVGGRFCVLNKKDRNFHGASPPVASGRLRSPPVDLARQGKFLWAWGWFGWCLGGSRWVVGGCFSAQARFRD